jgi:hypothetical protein
MDPNNVLIFRVHVLSDWRLSHKKLIGWGKLRNEKLHNLYSSPVIIRMTKLRRMRWAGHVTRMGEKRNAYRLLVGKPEGKRPLGRQRRRCVDDIKMELRVMGWERYGLACSASGYGQVEGSCENGNEPAGSIKCWEFLV